MIEKAMWHHRKFKSYIELCDWLNKCEYDTEQIVSINQLNVVWKSHCGSKKNEKHEDGYY